MRVPLSWLKEFVDVYLTPEKLAERLTVLGMQVQSIDRWGSDWTDVVVGELLTVEKHPRADRLSLTTVTVGAGEPLSIVCGATNIAPGQRVPVALPGAVLPGGRRIERAEKSGVVSNGMLCSGDELRLTSDADGILILPADAPIGRLLADLYGDVVLDVDVKPNRGDALSILGLAREVAAATGGEVRGSEGSVLWREPEPEETDGPPTAERVRIVVLEAELCTRFVARWVDHVQVGPSPDAVQMRLLAAGQRPISNVVDATNYVMLELGKPIHAYDADRVAQGEDGRPTIIVRRARPRERVETLDHIDRELSTEDLVIADRSGAIGIAGVMGGATTEVAAATGNVIIESAIFDPVSIRRTAQRHGLRSEASSRFEKGQESRMARIGAARTAELLQQWAQGRVAPGRVDTNPEEPGRTRVTFRPDRIVDLLGIDIPVPRQRELLERVGVETEESSPAEPVAVALLPEPFYVESGPGKALTALIPTWRHDLRIEADVAEEVARVHGYDRTPSLTPDTPMPPFRGSPLEVRDLVRETMAGAGLTEAVTPALVSPRDLQVVAFRRPVPSVDGEPEPLGEPIRVTNPLSRDHSVLRQTLIPSLLDVVATNQRHGLDDVAIFEIGKGYAKDGVTAREWWRLAIALTGAADPPHHTRPPRAYDIDDAKGLIELLCRRLGYPRPVYAPETDEPALHPGRTARTIAGDRLRGIVGELHPAMAREWELRGGRVVIAELAVSGLSGGRLVAEPSPFIGRVPPVERDLAIVVTEGTPAGRVEDVIHSSGGALLRDVRLFDVYRGQPLAADERSLAYRLTFAAEDRTLIEEEVNEAVDAVIAAVRGIGGRIRS